MGWNFTPDYLIGAIWLLWVVSWLVAAFWSDRASLRAPGQWRYRLITWVGILVLARPFAHRHHMVWQSPVVIGIAFAWWARIHLGRLWSANVTRKADHPIIDTGPYGMVRHPIYTGLLLALIGTALARGRNSDFAGVALIIYGTYLKARLEESFLRTQLGADAYNQYAARVPMLVPFTNGRSVG